MVRSKILFICGSLNQAKIMYEISCHLEQHDCYFTTDRSQYMTNQISNARILFNSISQNKSTRIILEYLAINNLNIDIKGENENYNLVFTCSDSGIAKNIKSKNVIFVQDGIPEPQKYSYNFMNRYNVTRWITNSSKLIQNDTYSKFCVGSEEYKNHFINKGIDADKIIVTGIPDFDNYSKYINNDFPHSGYALAITKDSRENYKFENRQSFIYDAVKEASDRKLIFRLNQNENFDRAIWEINNYASGSLIFTEGETGEMIANCELLITRDATAVLIGLVLNKRVHSEFDDQQLKDLMPVQNGGRSVMNIADEAEKLLKELKNASVFYFPVFNSSKLNFIQRYKLNQKLPTESV